MPSRCPNSVWVTNVLCRLNSFSPITLLWPPSKFGGLGSGSHRDGNLRVRFLQKPRKKKIGFICIRKPSLLPSHYLLETSESGDRRDTTHLSRSQVCNPVTQIKSDEYWAAAHICTQHCCHKTLLSGGQPELWNKYVNHNQDIGCIPLVLSSGVHQSLVLGVAPVSFQLNPPKNGSLATVLRLGP